MEGGAGGRPVGDEPDAGAGECRNLIAERLPAAGRHHHQPVAAAGDLLDHPVLQLAEAGYWWMDPALQAVQDHSLAVVLDVILVVLQRVLTPWTAGAR